jgi:predicted Ser/Thr protein kinase/tetratricopeptide (TPR) repeat protein
VDSCLSENVVAALVSGRLPRAELAGTELHLDTCAACRELVAHALRAAGSAAAPVRADVLHIGRYRVLREVGAGGMGKVYAAQDPDLGREVALKILRPTGRAERDDHRARLAREARAMARLAHPNVITVYEIGAADDQLFIAMELVKGGTLRRWLRAEPRGWRAVVEVLCAAGRGLAAAHAAGIVHRDFKPDNVLVGDDGRVRVTDFGVARLAAIEATLPAGTAETEPATSLTASGAILGTPAYMAPEQLRGEAADERADLFSFCVTFWEALYGERPFAGRNLHELRAALAAGAVRPPPEGRDVPPPLRDALRRGLQPAPGDRPTSMTQLLAAIEAAAALDEPGARPRPGAARIFGRDRELALAEAALRRARAGSGSLLLVTGEAGIGKSRLAREVAARAAASGVRALWGRAWEAGGAMPYWPWVQIFRGLGASPFEALAPTSGESAREERFVLFDAVARALEAAARREPLVLLLEDLHAADVTSLLLLLFVARQIGSSPVLLLATARELEARAAPELTDALAQLAREGEVISLGRLGPGAVADWVADRASGASADEIYRVTEGNPLFVEQMLRLGGDGRHLRLSDGIRGVLDAHLARLAPAARALLEAAAVIGRQFGSRELAALAGLPHDEVRSALESARELGVLEASGAEQLQFTHVLLRERLHQSLPVARRSELHWRAGVLAEASGANAAACARHLLEGVDAGDAEHAARTALRAAEQAGHQLAFESAIALGERALAVLPSAPSLVTCELERTVGEGLLRSGAIEAGHERCLRAAELARTLGARDELARAALAYACERIPTRSDPVMVQLLEEARVALGPADGALAARVSAELSTALLPPKREADLELVQRHAREALTMARRLGDPDTLLYVLQHVRAGVAYLMTGDQRFEIVREIAELAEARQQLLIYVHAAPDYAAQLLERGRRADADAHLAAMSELCAVRGSDATRWRLPMLRAAFALFDGDADSSERLLDETLAIAARAGTTPAPILWAKHRVAVAIAMGAPGRITPHAERVIAMLPNHTFFAPFRTWVLAAIGRRDEAIALLEQLPSMPYVLHGLLIAAEACKLLQHRSVAAQLYQQIVERCPGARFYWGALGIAFAIGPVPRLLGELALLTGDTATARRHFEESIALCRQIGARPFLELSVAALERCADASQEAGDGRIQ